MNKTDILAFAEECHARSVTALLNNKAPAGGEFKTSGERYAYIAGMQATVIEKLVEYIKTH
ncbi:hypothetical protein SCRM01_233 [Synechococcus phage S-CRM01]|uniref:hypothetical protein n=1 Tax=Synechococcus phage S-CRM01 TaxID=1026955 RepID=UPI000209E43A|nr:hypothetical protein SCRM01_233 [Synechococcus phage S-CRM01]AEC53179.1 hypothetical protein SCRM01_233 [Synechococcus phage S-CRM01]